ncbi:zinc finger MYM-type protein 1 isoform X3 [Agrilus planipennis]|uniref:Zinc finger MYM-type protein 1 isoform X3 n=1 Tax=Agrilus planipennis TaxID=224129 RepID=A0A1W4WYS2_AGRPL|nr:zinc finger MYM-type protein 1 isoform X3 [Agrilus planipennis]
MSLLKLNSWICGCNKKNALFCFPCLLFGGDKAWTEVGVKDLVHLNDKIKRHENSKRHLHNTMELTLLGRTNIKAQLDSAYWINVQEHNDNVTKNRYVLSKIINCIKFCGAFELALRGQDEIETSQNPGIFRGLINLSAELNATLREHLQNVSVFKEHSTDIQNDLLDCILEVCHEEIIKEINKSSFLAVMADEIADVSAKTQLAVILRYTVDGEPIERFWKYLNPTKWDAETLSENIFSIIDPLIKNSPYKLISQSYDGGEVMSGQHAGVQAKIRQKYSCAHFVHCYAHQLNLIISKAASINSQVRVFFGNLKEIPTFFNNSPQQVEVLNEIVRRKNPQVVMSSCNFNIRTINVVFENRDSLIECMEEIEEQFNNETVCSAASSIRRMLEDSVFVFWLTFFHHLMPHVDILFNQLQKGSIDPIEVETAVHNFEKGINHIRNNIDDIIIEASSNVCTEPQEKKIKRAHIGRFNHRIAALEICDLITNSAKDRFMFNDHLLAASLFFSEHFGEYWSKFPDDKLATTCIAYPTLEKERLRTELSVIYSRNDCKDLSGILPLLKFLIQNNLEETLREIKKLLEIIATTPMSTLEAERCFSTLKKIKTFLRNSVSQDRLTALSMLSIEKLFISKINSFNEKVIDKFASMKDRRIELTFKKQEHYQMHKEECPQIHDFMQCGQGGRSVHSKGNDQDEEKTTDNVVKDNKQKRSYSAKGSKNSHDKEKPDVDSEQRNCLTEVTIKCSDAHSDEQSNSENSDTDLDEHSFTSKDNREKKNLIKWRDEEKQAIEFFFHKHIKHRISPKKQEVLQLMKLYPNLFKDRKWDLIKIYVRNKYNSESENNTIQFVSVQCKEDDHVSPFLCMDIKEEPTRVMNSQDFQDDYSDQMKVEEKEEESPTTLDMDLKMMFEEDNEQTNTSSTIKTEHPVENIQLPVSSLQTKLPLPLSNCQLPANSALLLIPETQETSNTLTLLNLNKISPVNLSDTISNPPPP